jgi:hypothetical protein
MLAQFGQDRTLPFSLAALMAWDPTDRNEFTARHIPIYDARSSDLWIFICGDFPWSSCTRVGDQIAVAPCPA